MKDSGFRCTGDISRGNTLARWSTPAASTFDNGPLALLHRSRSGFPGTIERGYSPALSAALRPKWQIIHAHSPGGRTIEPQLLGPGQSRPIERLTLGAGVATQVTRRQQVEEISHGIFRINAESVNSVSRITKTIYTVKRPRFVIVAKRSN